MAAIAIAARRMSTRRFYETVGVYGDAGRYAVTLDRRTARTVGGAPLVLESEPLALAVANEWDARTTPRDATDAHLTSLSGAVIDGHSTPTALVDYAVNHLATDTLLFHSHEGALYELQTAKWDPIVDWFRDRFRVDVEQTTGIEPPAVGAEARAALSRHLRSYHFAAINGLVFGIDALKSVILMLAAVERRISPEEAVHLSRLEEEYQMTYWGKVTWSHDLHQNEMQSRLCAALLFVHFNSFQLQSKTKNLHL